MAKFEQLLTLTFTWRLLAPGCPAINYNILASNCGSCPTTTNHTVTVTCADVPTDGSVCAFTVQIVVCGNIAGNTSVLVPLLDDHTPDVMVSVYDFFVLYSLCFMSKCHTITQLQWILMCVYHIMIVE